MKIVYLPLLSIIVSLAFTACNKEGDSDRGKLEPAKAIVLQTPAKVETDNSFALNLFKAICEAEAGNAFISPLSVSIALNMALNGAEGETKREMLETLSSGGYTLQQINDYSKELREALLAIDPSTKINIANSIWYRKGFDVKAPFIIANQSYYTAQVGGLDFTAPSAVETINGWCDTNTSGRINTIITEIPPLAMMYLVNAVYFKGIWVFQFDEKATLKAPFTTAGGEIQQVDMMHRIADFNYTREADFACLELPYGNGAFSMLLMLPREGKATGEVISKLDSELWNSLPGKMHKAELVLSLPRMKAECSFTLKNILSGMGMESPFRESAADFSGISDTELFISEVIHKTFLEIDERGTEAAAVTAVVMETTAVPEQTSFKVDRPFVLAIKENSTGAILFIGRIDRIE